MNVYVPPKLRGDVRDEFVAALTRIDPAEVLEFRKRLDEGRVMGRVYSCGDCGCLIGTVGLLRGLRNPTPIGPLVLDGIAWNNLVEEVRADHIDEQSEWENSLARVDKGDTPETSEAAREFAEAIDEFIMSNPEAFAEVQL